MQIQSLNRELAETLDFELKLDACRFFMTGSPESNYISCVQISFGSRQLACDPTNELLSNVLEQTTTNHVRFLVFRLIARKY